MEATKPRSNPEFQTDDNNISIDVLFDEETVWLTLDQMASLFERDKSTISSHIKNVFAEEELTRDSVVAKYATTAIDGKTYQSQDGRGTFHLAGQLTF